MADAVMIGFVGVWKGEGVTLPAPPSVLFGDIGNPSKEDGRECCGLSAGSGAPDPATGPGAQLSADPAAGEIDKRVKEIWGIIAGNCPIVKIANLSLFSGEFIAQHTACHRCFGFAPESAPRACAAP